MTKEKLYDRITITERIGRPIAWHIAYVINNGLILSDMYSNETMLDACKELSTKIKARDTKLYEYSSLTAYFKRPDLFRMAYLIDDAVEGNKNVSDALDELADAIDDMTGGGTITWTPKYDGSHSMELNGGTGIPVTKGDTIVVTVMVEKLPTGKDSDAVLDGVASDQYLIVKDDGTNWATGSRGLFDQWGEINGVEVASSLVDGIEAKKFYTYTLTATKSSSIAWLGAVRSQSQYLTGEITDLQVSGKDTLTLFDFKIESENEPVVTEFTSTDGKFKAKWTGSMKELSKYPEGSVSLRKPVIVGGVNDITVSVGDTNKKLMVYSSGAKSYKWFKNGEFHKNTTVNSLTLPKITMSMNGDKYYAIAVNPAGESGKSSEATVTVTGGLVKLDRPIKVGILGDSFVAHTDNRNKNDITSAMYRQEGIGSGILSHYVEKVDLYVHGFSGQTLPTIATKVDAMLAQKPDFVVVQGGVNDIDQAVATADSAKAMNEILTKVKAAGVPAVMCTVPYFAGTGNNTKVDTINAALSAELAKFPNFKQVPFKLFNNDSTGEYPMQSFDKIHPDAIGGNAFGNDIVSVMSTMIESTFVIKKNLLLPFDISQSYDNEYGKIPNGYSAYDDPSPYGGTGRYVRTVVGFDGKDVVELASTNCKSAALQADTVATVAGDKYRMAIDIEVTNLDGSSTKSDTDVISLIIQDDTWNWNVATLGSINSLKKGDTFKTTLVTGNFVATAGHKVSPSIFIKSGSAIANSKPVIRISNPRLWCEDGAAPAPDSEFTDEFTNEF